ncbi:MAG: hypothetical protein EGQ00_11330 [Parabacteroides johnsonii]|nr:hypothetical protein [Parabacteroides johnsonii]
MYGQEYPDGRTKIYLYMPYLYRSPGYYSVIGVADYKISAGDYIISDADYIITGGNQRTVWHRNSFICNRGIFKFSTHANKYFCIFGRL